MKRIVPIPVLALLAVLLVPSLSTASQCYDCHSSWEEGDDAPSVRFQYDVHNSVGLTCSDCHGGDPTLDDMDKVRAVRGYKGIPSPKQIPEFCASCHSDPTYMVKHNPALPTDQLDKYKTSIHGQRLFGRNDTKVANCISCHSVHNIQQSSMPTSTVNAFNIPATCATCHANPDYMRGYGIPTNQYDDFVGSVHGVALLENKDAGAPACNDCHGNHGATPPGVTSISAVCGLCHALVADKFAVSPHKVAFDLAGYPECETCHSNHNVQRPSISWVGSSDSALCVDCHSTDDGTSGLATADKINSALTELDSTRTQALAALNAADEKGMMITDEFLQLKEVDQAIIEAATMFHSLNADSVKSVTAEGIATAVKVKEASLGKIDEYYFRRKGLGVATLIITVLSIALYFKIRSIKK